MKPSLLIIGLGNPGKSYEKTRHNTGFLAIDMLEKHYGTGPWKDRPKYAAHIAEGRVVTAPVLLVKPQTYMNVSGETVRKMIDFYKLRPTDHIIIICDDVDLPCGTIRLRKKGSAGTHNGLKSVVEQIGEEFPRLRIGIGPKPDREDLATWVLSTFTKEEEKKIEEALQKLPDMLTAFILGNTSSPPYTLHPPDSH